MLFNGHSEAILDRHLHRREAPHEHIEIVPLKPADTVVAPFQHLPETTLGQPFGVHQKSVAVPFKRLHGPAVL
nr:hypothetical protein IL210_00029 [uncultured bacterium]QTC34802.1 hypothetical protein IL214_00026 [uncultured bacterium]QTC35315.1 hypothetical protein IL228_00016 [uncultured bacterium]